MAAFFDFNLSLAGALGPRAAVFTVAAGDFGTST
jgi:hypothetical protein